MYIYAGIATIVAVVAGIRIAARTKKADGLVYGKLDQTGRITNILLIPVYALLTLFFWPSVCFSIRNMTAFWAFWAGSWQR